MSEKTNRDFFCSQLSVQAKEEIYGTASGVDVWFLLEYAGPWAAQAFTGSSLPEAVKDRLGGYLNTIPHARLLFIKQQPRSVAHLAFYIVVSHELRPILYEFQLSTYEDVLALDIPAMVSGNAKGKSFVREDPLFLVCTHGTHDKCCAKFGLPVYKELAKHGGSSVWQCSHVGGDRFAANVVCFPHAIYYGHVVESEIATVVEEYRRQRIYLEKYRGRSCYSFAEQAADYLLRVETGVRELPGFRLVENQCIAEDRWTMRFSSVDNEQTHVVRLSRQKSAFRNYLSCRALKELRVDQYRLASHEVLGL